MTSRTTGTGEEPADFDDVECAESRMSTRGRLKDVVRGAVRLEHDALYLPGGRKIPRREIEGAFLAERGRRFRHAAGARREVVLKLRGVGEREAMLVFRAPEDAERFMSLLGMDASQHRARVRIASPIASSGALLALFFSLYMVPVSIPVALAFMLGATGTTFALAAAASGLLLIATIVLALRRAEVVVGTDGLLIVWNGVRRFFPYGEIESVREDGMNVALKLKGDRQYVIRVAPVGAMRDSDQGRLAVQQQRLLIERVEQAREAARGAVIALDPASLARGDDTVDAWRTRLRSLGQEAGKGFRDAAVTADSLWALVQDAAASTSARGAAAVLLASKTDDAGRARLRVAADAMASPKLRVVVETAARSEHSLESDEVARALGELSDGDARLAARRKV